MRPYELDEARAEARLSFSSALYSRSALEEAARAFEAKAEAEVAGRGARLTVVLRPKPPVKAGALEGLAREFLNEALSQERRRDVVRSQREVVHWIATRALFSAMSSPDHERRMSAIDRELESQARALADELGGGAA